MMMIAMSRLKFRGGGGGGEEGGQAGQYGLELLAKVFIEHLRRER